MPGRQSWSISQDANKKKGTCPVCMAQRQLHNKDGKLHLHGPRQNPCPGSNQRPLEVSRIGHTSSQPVSTVRLTASSNTLDDINVTPCNTRCSANLPNASIKLQHPQLPGPTLKHIPKSARTSCAMALADILRRINSNPNDSKAWALLLDFGTKALLVSPRGGKRHNTASTVKNRLTLLEDPSQDVTVKNNVTDRPKLSTGPRLLASLVRGKMEDGNVTAAVRILCSNDKFSAPSVENFIKLQQKHPHASPARLVSKDFPEVAPLIVAEEDVIKAVRSFPSGSSGGPDGIRPQHILELVNNKESAHAFLPALTSFVNLLLSGKCPEDVQPILFGGRLIALEKKTGDLRPIAVGYTWRRLASKCANAVALHKMRSSLLPFQVGVGVKGGCEAAVHAVRRFLSSMTDECVLVKLDFANAFNSLRRDKILEAVYRDVPEIYNFCHSAYSGTSLLQYGEWLIESQEGVQQGDPIGPLLFCLTIQPLLNALNSSLKVGYLDDITLGGSSQVVSEDVSTIIREGQELGLSLNICKCELIKGNFSGDLDALLASFIAVDLSAAFLLGAPLSSGSCMEESLNKAIAALKVASDRLKLVCSHDALILLKNSLSTPKVTHIIRAAPCFGHPLLADYDLLLRSSLCSIVNVDLTNEQWSQASLPTRNGGLGIRQLAQLAPSAFLASAVGSRCLQDLILVRCDFIDDEHVNRALQYWSSLHNASAPVEGLSHRQKMWDQPIVNRSFNALLEASHSPSDRARLLAVSSEKCSDWLQALPISSCGLLMSDEAVRVAIGLRLGARICEPHTCQCGATVDARGAHCLSCKKGSCRIIRHNNLNDIIYRALVKAQIPTTKEPCGLSRSDGKRPDGQTLIPWKCGKSAIWDVTVCDTLANSYVGSTSVIAGSAAESAASKKVSKYSDLMSAYDFYPVAFETLGPLNTLGHDFISEIGRAISRISGDPRETSFFRQRLSVALQKYNAVCLSQSFPSLDSLSTSATNVT